MEAPDSLDLLVKRCLRGCIVFRVLWLLSLAGCAALLIFSETRPWALAAFLLCVSSSLALKHVRDRYESAKRLLAAETSVYWVQPRTTAGTTRKVLAGKELLRLHLSNGDQLEIDMPESEVSKFREWIDQDKSEHRWGTAYERTNA